MLADFGYVTIRITSDWGGADFIAQHKDGEFLKVQLKGRLTFDRKYLGQNLYVCFKDDSQGPWYLYDHDELLKAVDIKGTISNSETWKSKKPYHFSSLSKDIEKLLEPYRIGDAVTLR